MRGSVLTLTSDAAAEDRSLEFLNDEGGLHLSLSTNAGIGVLSQRGTSGDFENYWMQCHRDGGVGLYHDGLLRLLTTAEGIDVMDDITLQDGGALWTSDSTGVDSKSAFFEHYLHLGNYGSFSSATYAHLNFHTYAGGTASYDARILCNTGSGHATLAGRGHLYYYAGTHEWQQDGVQAMRNSLSGGYPLFETWGQHICWGYTTANASLSIVGHSTSNSHSNTVWYDNVPTAVAYMRNDGIIYATNFLGTSDRNRKRAIIDETSSRHELRQIKPVNFEFIADHEREGETMRRTGFIAQDVLPHIPEAITWTEGTPDQVQADGTVLKGAPASFAMELPAMIPTLWNSTRELDEEVEAQKLVNTRQRNNITALEEAVALLQTQVAALVAAA
jgi:hypothetical protein